MSTLAKRHEDFEPSPATDDVGLEDVGVHAVLGAMIEQKRRASQPAPCEVEPTEASDAPPSRPPPRLSQPFLKVR